MIVNIDENLYPDVKIYYGKYRTSCTYSKFKRFGGTVKFQFYTTSKSKQLRYIKKWALSEKLLYKQHDCSFSDNLSSGWLKACRIKELNIGLLGTPTCVELAFERIQFTYKHHEYYITDNVEPILM